MINNIGLPGLIILLFIAGLLYGFYRFAFSKKISAAKLANRQLATGGVLLVFGVVLGLMSGRIGDRAHFDAVTSLGTSERATEGLMLSDGLFYWSLFMGAVGAALLVVGFIKRSNPS